MGVWRQGDLVCMREGYAHSEQISYTAGMGVPHEEHSSVSNPRMVAVWA